jgi:hypothetical protein
LWTRMDTNPVSIRAFYPPTRILIGKGPGAMASKAVPRPVVSQHVLRAKLVII